MKVWSQVPNDQDGNNSWTESTWHKCLDDKPIWIALPSQNCLVIHKVINMWTQVCFDNMATFFTNKKKKKTFERSKVLLKHLFEEKFNKLSWIFDCNSCMEISKAIFIQIFITVIWIDFSFQYFICKATSPSRICWSRKHLGTVWRLILLVLLLLRRALLLFAYMCLWFTTKQFMRHLSPRVICKAESQ